MSSVQSPSSAPPSRSRFWIVLLSVVVVPVLLIGGMLWYAGYAAEAELNAAIAEVDQIDPNWRLAQIEEQRPVLTDDENAAVQVLKARAAAGGNYGNQPSFYTLFEGLTPENQLNSQQIAALEAELQKYDQGVIEARKLIDFKQGRYPVAYTPDFIGTLLKVQDAREVARILIDDVMLHAQKTDAAGAVRSWRALWIVARSIDDEPFLISQLVRIAIEAMSVNSLQRLLAQTEPSADDLAVIQAQIEEDAGQSLWLFGMRGERAGMDMLFENMESGQVSRQALLTTLADGLSVRDGVDLITPGSLKRQRAQLLRFETEIVEIARKPPHEWKAALAPLEARTRSMPMLVRLLTPAVTKIAEGDMRRFAQVRCAIVAVAAERYRLAHQKWPESLDALVQAGLVKEVPLDPYDGKPLRLRWLPDGLIVYSIGPDCQDNNGKRDPQNPIATGTDVTFRLWNPTSRRQPAKPPKPMESVPGGDPTPAGLAPAP